MNVIARLEFELAYYDFAVQLFNHLLPTIALTIPRPRIIWIEKKKRLQLLFKLKESKDK